MARFVHTRDGLRIYAQKLKLFTPNAKKVLLYSSLTGLAFGVFRLLFNFYVLSLGGYDEQFLGLLTSVSSLASLTMAIPAAYLANRFPHKRIMVTTGVISALAFVGFVLLPYRPFLILFNVISGLAMSARQVTVAPFLMDNTSPEERQYVFSFNFGMITTAEFVGNMLGGLLPTWLGGMVGAMPTDTLAYQMALGSMVIVSMLAVGPLLSIRPTAADTARRADMPWSQLQQDAGRIAKLLTPNFIIGLGAGLMMPFMNVYYRHVFGRSDSTIGTLFAMGALTMAIAQFLAPPIADRLGKINTVVVTQALSVPFLLTLGLAAWIVPGGRADLSLWFAIAAVAYLFRLALMNLSGPVYQTFILESVQPSLQALAAGLNSVSFQFGWAFSPYLSGWFQTTYGEFGFVPVFLTTSLLYIVGIVVTWAFFRHAERPATSSRPSEARTVTT